MNLRHLTIFKTVCEQGGVTSAAKALSMTQPAVSHAITELEEFAGAQLFDRVSRKIVLNETGRFYLSKVIPLLELYDELEHASSRMDNRIPLKIGSCVTLASFLLPSAIKRFNQSYPDVHIQVVVNNSREIEQKLLHNEVDLGLIEGVIDHELLEKIPFSAYPLAVICSPRHPFASLPSITIDQLVSEPLLLREKNCTIRDTFDSALMLHNLTAVPIWSSTNSDVLLQAVKQNIGISVLPRIFADEYVQRGEIVEIEVADLDISCMNHVVFKKDKFQTEAFQSFINLILFD